MKVWKILTSMDIYQEIEFELLLIIRPSHSHAKALQKSKIKTLNFVSYTSHRQIDLIFSRHWIHFEFCFFLFFSCCLDYFQLAIWNKTAQHILFISLTKRSEMPALFSFFLSVSLNSIIEKGVNTTEFMLSALFFSMFFCNISSFQISCGFDCFVFLLFVNRNRISQSPCNKNRTIQNKWKNASDSFEKKKLVLGWNMNSAKAPNFAYIAINCVGFDANWRINAYWITKQYSPVPFKWNDKW